MPNAECLDFLTALAARVGKELLNRQADVGQIRHKQDNSPVSAADEWANGQIVAALQQEFPDIPVVAEESALPDPTQLGERFFLVDPLDGTKAYLRGGKDFSVNIGLIEQRYPVAGVIGLPAFDETYAGSVQIPSYCIAGATKKPIHTRTPGQQIDVAKSGLHDSPQSGAFLQQFNVRHIMRPSSAMKFCLLARGTVDLYPRFGRTMEWDTAAGQAIVEAAGGRVETLDGKRFAYAKPNFANAEFVAFGWK